VSIRITSGTELADARRTQPRPVNAWITTELFIGIAPQIAHMYIQISQKEIYTCRHFSWKRCGKRGAVSKRSRNLRFQPGHCSLYAKSQVTQ
jgi:hypothetical protein